MSAELENLAAEMYRGQTPSMWLKVSYPSLKPLASYVTDLVKKLDFLSNWTEQGLPPVVWLPGIHFTHSFLTATLQKAARKTKVAIDEITFDFEFLYSGGDNPGGVGGSSEGSGDVQGGAGGNATQVTEAAESGVYINGLYLEGAAWDQKKERLVECEAKKLYTEAPIIWLKPVLRENVKEFAHYSCPLYRTSERRGILSTTGISTNFVMPIRLPSVEKSEHWILRGVALLAQLDD